MDNNRGASNIADRMQEMSVEWQKRGNVNYRSFKMCDLQWTTFIIGQDKYGAEFEISGSIVAAALNGGPIAVVNKKNNFLSGGSHLLKDHIAMFNACGKLIEKVTVKNDFLNKKIVERKR